MVYCNDYTRLHVHENETYIGELVSPTELDHASRRESISNMGYLDVSEKDICVQWFRNLKEMKGVKTTSAEKRIQGYMTKINYYSKRENNTQKTMEYFTRNQFIYIYIYIYSSEPWTTVHWTNGWSMAPNTVRTISCKAWNSPVKYPNWQFELEIKEFDGNMFHPIS